MTTRKLGQRGRTRTLLGCTLEQPLGGVQKHTGVGVAVALVNRTLTIAYVCLWLKALYSTKINELDDSRFIKFLRSRTAPEAAQCEI